ncbi:Uncharacterised protein [Mycobacterium tuberculosis]|nr:Uncharacterised protein [Mycobacterium tuberculosis]
MSGSSASSSGPIPSTWERLSPVFITKSGSRAASECMKSIFFCWPGIMCISEICRILKSGLPAGNTGRDSVRS